MKTKKRFLDNKPQTCDDSIGQAAPKKERIAQTENNIRSHKVQLKKMNKYLDALKGMSGDYDYNNESLAMLVGNVFMNIDRAKGWIDREKNILKTLKGKN